MLRSTVRDLAALIALPAMWSGKEPSYIAGNLLDVLCSMLRLDIAYVCLHEAPGVAGIEAVRPADQPDSGRWQRALGRLAARWFGAPDLPSAIALPSLAGKARFRVAAVRLGAEGRGGLVVVGSWSPHFPSELESFLLGVATNQATTALHAARLLATLRERERQKDELIALHQAARAEAEAATEKTRRVQSVTDAALAHLALDDLLHELLGRLHQILDIDTGAIFLVDGARPRLILRAAQGFEEGVEHVPIPVGEGVAGRVALERRPIIVEEVEKAETVSPYLPGGGIRSLLGVPLLVGGRVLGVLRLGSRRVRGFTGEDAALLELAADRIALAIESARLYEAERRARGEAEAANQAKDEFLATLSHELRTPLTSMLGWARLLRTGALDAATSARALESIDRNIHLQTKLVEDLLDVSRIISGKLELDGRPVHLPAVIDAALEAVRPAADAKAIRLATTLDAAGAPVWGDAARLQQVVWNLLSNAVKFTPREGRVEVRLERAAHDACIVVSDTGPGIPADFLPYIFDRFRQADGGSTRRHGGLGLGLSIVRHLVEIHGGAVQAASPGPGQGATFTVMLPLMAAGAPAPSPGPVPESLGREPGAGRLLEGVRVLVVDDEVDARDLLVTVLRHDGAEVIGVGSAGQARAVLAMLRPEVLVADIAMPGEDGYELIRGVRAGGPAQTIPALAVTSYARNEDRERALAAGFDVHLAKPVEPAEFCRIVAALSRRGRAA